MVDEIKYRRIAAQLESEIRGGKYATRALPSEMQLVRRFGVGRKTVQRAMLELQYRGIVTRMHGKGTFLTERGANLTGLLGLLIPNAASQSFFQSFAREVARVGQEKGYTFLYGVAGFDDIDSARLSVPSLTTIHQPIARIAECAFEALQYRMGRSAGMPPREILLDAPLVERDSTADHKAKRRNRKE